MSITIQSRNATLSSDLTLKLWPTMNSTFPANLDGNFDWQGDTTQSQASEMEVDSVLDDQIMAGFISVIEVPGEASLFHSNTNVRMSPVLDTAGIEGTEPQNLFHSFPGSLQPQSRITLGQSPKFLGPSISSDNPSYQSQQRGPSLFSSPISGPTFGAPLNFIRPSTMGESSAWPVLSNNSNPLGKMVLETQLEGSNQPIINLFQQFPQMTLEILQSSLPSQIESGYVSLGNHLVFPEAQQIFTAQIPQVNNVPSREDSININIPQNLTMPSQVLADDWAKIGPMFKLVYDTSECTLEQTASFLEVVFGFRATLDQYNYRLKNGWPNGRGAREKLRKNKSSSANPTKAKIRKGKGNPNRRRPYKRSAKYDPCPHFLALLPKVCIPQPLEPGIYKNQIMLLRYTDKYVTGFFDSTSSIKVESVSEENIGNYLVPIEFNWLRLLNCCQGMLALMRKSRNFVLPDFREEAPLAKKEKQKKRIIYLRRVIDRTLEDRVFNLLDKLVEDCSPFVLSYFWSICHILLDLSRQLGSSKGAYVARFLRSLHPSFKLNNESNDQHSDKGINTGFVDIINHLVPYFGEDILDQNEDKQKQKQNENDGFPEVFRYLSIHKEDGGQQKNQDEINQGGNKDEEVRRQKRAEFLEKWKEAQKVRKEKKQQDIKEDQACNSRIQHIIRTSYHCAVRAFSTRRNPTDPNVLRIWADYSRHWDPSALEKSQFLKNYKKAFQNTERFYGSNHHYSIHVLCSYATAAYYICHEKDLAKDLANKLWDRTHDAFTIKHPTWSAKTQGLAEAASILGHSVCIYHENMHKDSNEMRKIRRKLGLRRKKYRQRWKTTLGPPPPPDQACNILTRLDEAVRSLMIGDWDCQILAQKMAYNLAGLLLNFCGPEEQYKQAAMGHLELGNQCLSRIFSEADPSPGENIVLDIENTICPAQLHPASWPPWVGKRHGDTLA